MRHLARVLVASLLLATAPVAGASPNAAVGKAIGGKAMPGYKAPRGKTLKLAKPWRLKSKNEKPGDGPLISLRRGNHAVQYLDKHHYRDVRESALTIMRKYRPESHFYVALGRSPTALFGFLAELNPYMTMTFPVSDLRLDPLPNSDQAFDDHFEKLLPDDVLRGDRTIVLFDRSHDRSGKSLSALHGRLADYLQRRNGKRVAIRSVGLANQGPLIKPVEHLSTAERPNTFRYLSSGNDQDEIFAPFLNKHRVGAEPMEAIKENPTFWQMRDALKVRMAHDRDLKKVLKEEFADLLDSSSADADGE